MITLTNYSSGEVTLSDDSGVSIHLTRDQAHRLILAARMHTVVEFLEKIPLLISDPQMPQKIISEFEGKTSSERWNLKEKFARLTTLTKGYVEANPGEIMETVQLDLFQ